MNVLGCIALCVFIVIMIGLEKSKNDNNNGNKSIVKSNKSSSGRTIRVIDFFIVDREFEE